MSRFARLKMIIVSAGLFLSASAATVSSTAEARSKKLPKKTKAAHLSLEDVETDATKNLSVITATLSEDPQYKTPALKDHGSFLQLTLPSTIVPESGKFYEGSGDIVTKVAVFQTTTTKAAIRIFLSADASQIKAASKAEILGNRVMITIDHKKAAPFLAAAGKKGVDRSTTDAKAVVKPSDLLNPKDGTPAESSFSNLLGAKVPDLSKRLSQLAVFGGILIVFFVIAMLFKPLLRRKSNGAKQAEAIKMRTLSTLPLATKQKLSLIQVGDERILVGVTPENISYIATLDSEGSASITAASMNRSRRSSTPIAGSNPVQAMLQGRTTASSSSFGDESSETNGSKRRVRGGFTQFLAEQISGNRKADIAPPRMASESPRPTREPAAASRIAPMQQEPELPQAQVQEPFPPIEAEPEERPRERASAVATQTPVRERNASMATRNFATASGNDSFEMEVEDTLESLTKGRKKSTTRSMRAAASRGSRLNIAIDDDGIHQMNDRVVKDTDSGPQKSETQKAIDDVTQLIRDKLKNSKRL